MNKKCHWCGKPADRLCDYVVARAWPTDDPKDRVTCDRPLCSDCAANVGRTMFCGKNARVETIDYCPSHMVVRGLRGRTRWRYSTIFKPGDLDGAKRAREIMNAKADSLVGIAREESSNEGAIRAEPDIRPALAGSIAIRRDSELAVTLFRAYTTGETVRVHHCDLAPNARRRLLRVVEMVDRGEMIVVRLESVE